MFGLGPTLSSLFKYLYFLRFPLIFGVVPLWGLAYLGNSGPSTFQNAMLATHPFGFLSIGSQIAFLSIGVYLASAIVLRNAKERFGVQPWSLFSGWIGNRALVPIFMIILGGPLIFVVALANGENKIYSPITMHSAWVCAMYMGIGFIATGLALRGFKELADRTASKAPIFTRTGRGIAQFLGEGYYDRSNDQFKEGHIFMVFYVIVITATYIYGRIVLNPTTAVDYGEESVPALSYVLALPIMMTTISSGLAFLLDRFRVPVLGAMALITYGNYRFFENDNIFYIFPAKEVTFYNSEARPDAELSPVVTPVVAHRAALQRLEVVNKLSTRNQKTAIVVCASGGGIQAAGWTARVLSGLDEVTNGEFSSRVFLFTSASGGSVGGYMFLESYDRKLGKADPGRLDRIFPAATTSSLESALWGLTQPDFTRFFFSSTMQDQALDRGWALEESWREQANFVWGGVAKRDIENENGRYQQFGEWVSGSRDGVLPAVVFNSLIVETGGLLALSTVDFTDISEEAAFEKLMAERGVDLKELRENITDPDYRAAFYDRARREGIFSQGTPEDARARGLLPSAVRYQTFHRIFADPDHRDMAPDLNKRTAARLSATFPYITPIARPALQGFEGVDYEVPYYHVADGGFYDNLGIVPAVEWIRAVMFPDGLNGRIDRVVVLQIVAEPEPEEMDNMLPSGTPTKDGFRFVFAGPLEAIAKVRGSTQVKRSDLELGLLQQLDESSSIEVDVVRVQPPINVYEDGNPPLSWSLSPKNIESLKSAWIALTEDGDSEVAQFIAKYFPTAEEVKDDRVLKGEEVQSKSFRFKDWMQQRQSKFTEDGEEIPRAKKFEFGPEQKKGD